MSDEPKLDAPGKGLPFIEWFVAKYFIIPKILRSYTVEQSLALLDKEATAMTDIASTLTTEEAATRILVPRLQGLEDSSRYWSVGMTLEHLRIVTTGIRLTIARLAKGESIDKPTSTADVKPSDVQDINDVCRRFLNANHKFIESAKTLSDSTKKLKFPHPWFGELTVEQWLIFSPTHYKIHHRQILEIQKRLPSKAQTNG